MREVSPELRVRVRVRVRVPGGVSPSLSMSRTPLAQEADPDED